MIENKEIIEKVLKENSQNIDFEAIPSTTDSPLAQNVIEKADRSTGASNATSLKKSPAATGDDSSQPKPLLEAKAQNLKKEPQDAPEQKIDSNPGEKSPLNSDSSSQEPEFNMPVEQAGIMADTFMGIANNIVFEVGCGYFVTITKHKDFYDFDEVVQVIEEQNVKNVKRMRLDDEDKAMLRPLIIYIVRKKAKVLSPEAQLLGVALSIIIKKAKIVMEIRGENEILVERIREIIQKESGHFKDNNEEKEEEDHTTITAENETTKKEGDAGYEEVKIHINRNNTGLPDSILEVA